MDNMHDGQMRSGDLDDEIAELRFQALLTKKENEAEVTSVSENVHFRQPRENLYLRDRHMVPRERRGFPRNSRGDYLHALQKPFAAYHQQIIPINPSNIVVLTSDDPSRQESSRAPQPMRNIVPQQGGHRMPIHASHTGPPKASPYMLSKEKYINVPKENPDIADKNRVSAKMRRLQDSDSDSDDSDSDSSDSSTDSSSSDSSDSSNSSSSDTNSDSVAINQNKTKKRKSIESIEQVKIHSSSINSSKLTKGESGKSAKEKASARVSSIDTNVATNSSSHPTPANTDHKLPRALHQRNHPISIKKPNSPLRSHSAHSPKKHDAKKCIPDSSSQFSKHGASNDSPILTKRPISPYRGLSPIPLEKRSLRSPLLKGHRVHSSRSPRKYSRSPVKNVNKSPKRLNSRSPMPRTLPKRFSKSPLHKRFDSYSPNRGFYRSDKRGSRSPLRRKFNSRSPIRRTLSKSPLRKRLRSRSPFIKRFSSRSPVRKRYRSRSPLIRRSKSPYEKRLSRSPIKRKSPFKIFISRSPGYRDGTPKMFRSKSPIYRGKSPRFRSKSPRFRSKSPMFRGKSPMFRSNSPRLRSKSPRFMPLSRFRSKSPRFRSKSPRFRSKSPRFRSKSPRFRSKSPRFRSKSPRFRSKSPRIRSKSPLFRSKSPKGGRLSPRFRSKSPSLKNRKKRSLSKSPFNQNLRVVPIKASESSTLKYHSRSKSPLMKDSDNMKMRKVSVSDGKRLHSRSLSPRRFVHSPLGRSPARLRPKNDRSKSPVPHKSGYGKYMSKSPSPLKENTEKSQRNRSDILNRSEKTRKHLPHHLSESIVHKISPDIGIHKEKSDFYHSDHSTALPLRERSIDYGRNKDGFRRTPSPTRITKSFRGRSFSPQHNKPPSPMRGELPEHYEGFRNQQKRRQPPPNDEFYEASDRNQYTDRVKGFPARGSFSPTHNRGFHRGDRNSGNLPPLHSRNEQHHGSENSQFDNFHGTNRNFPPENHFPPDNLRFTRPPPDIYQNNPRGGYFGNQSENRGYNQNFPPPGPNDNRGRFPTPGLNHPPYFHEQQQPRGARGDRWRGRVGGRYNRGRGQWVDRPIMDDREDKFYGRPDHRDERDNFERGYSPENSNLVQISEKPFQNIRRVHSPKADRVVLKGPRTPPDSPRDASPQGPSKIIDRRPLPMSPVSADDEKPSNLGKPKKESSKPKIASFDKSRLGPKVAEEKLKKTKKVVKQTNKVKSSTINEKDPEKLRKNSSSFLPTDETSTDAKESKQVDSGKLKTEESNNLQNIKKDKIIKLCEDESSIKSKFEDSNPSELANSNISNLPSSKDEGGKKVDSKLFVEKENKKEKIRLESSRGETTQKSLSFPRRSVSPHHSAEMQSIEEPFGETDKNMSPVLDISYNIIESAVYSPIDGLSDENVESSQLDKHIDFEKNSKGKEINKEKEAVRVNVQGESSRNIHRRIGLKEEFKNKHAKDRIRGHSKEDHDSDRSQGRGFHQWKNEKMPYVNNENNEQNYRNRNYDDGNVEFVEQRRDIDGKMRSHRNERNYMEVEEQDHLRRDISDGYNSGNKRFGRNRHPVRQNRDFEDAEEDRFRRRDQVGYDRNENEGFHHSHMDVNNFGNVDHEELAEDRQRQNNRDRMIRQHDRRNPNSRDGREANRGRRDNMQKSASTSERHDRGRRNSEEYFQHQARNMHNEFSEPFEEDRQSSQQSRRMRERQPRDWQQRPPSERFDNNRRPRDYNREHILPGLRDRGYSKEKSPEVEMERERRDREHRKERSISRGSRSSRTLVKEGRNKEDVKGSKDSKRKNKMEVEEKADKKREKHKDSAKKKKKKHKEEEKRKSPKKKKKKEKEKKKDSKKKKKKKHEESEEERGTKKDKGNFEPSKEDGSGSKHKSSKRRHAKVEDEHVEEKEIKSKKMKGESSVGGRSGKHSLGEDEGLVKNRRTVVEVKSRSGKDASFGTVSHDSDRHVSTTNPEGQQKKSLFARLGEKVPPSGGRLRKDARRT